MTKSFLALAALAACATEPTPSAPTKTYEFSAATLRDLHHVDVPPGPLAKAGIRGGMQGVQPALLACYATYGQGATGTIELRLRLVGDTSGTIVDTVDVGGDAPLAGNAALADCMRSLVIALDLPGMQEPGVWLVHYPFLIP